MRPPYLACRWLVCVALGANLAALGCARPRDAAGMDSPLMALIPHDTPFAWIVAAPEGDQVPGGDELWLVRLLHRYVLDAVGIDLLAADAGARTGLELRGDMALFGAGLRPAAIVRITDRDALRSTLQQLRQDRRSVVEALAEGGPISARLTLGAVRVGLQQADDYLVVTYAIDGSEPLLPLSDVGLDDAALFRRVERALGISPRGNVWSTVAFVDTARLDELLLAAATARDGRADTAQSGVLETCRARNAALARELPFVAFATADDGVHVEQRLIVPLGRASSAVVQRVLQPLAASYELLAKDALVAFGVRFEVGALVELGALDVALTRCPGLGALEGALGVIGRGLADTDARAVLGGGLTLVVQGLDLSLPWFTKRQAALVVEAKDPAAVARGLSVILHGLGAEAAGADGEGSALFSVFGGTVMLRVIRAPGHVALALGAVEREALVALLADRGPATQGASRARLDVDPRRLREALAPMTEALVAGGVGSAMLRLVGRALRDLDSAGWELHIAADGAVIEGGWTRGAVEAGR